MPDDVDPMSEVRVRFAWREAGELSLDEEGRLVFPPLAKEPGVYRLDLVGGSGDAVYVGESVNLLQRASLYRFPWRRPSLARMNERMTSHLRDGGRIRLALCTEANLRSDGAWTPLDLRFQAARLIVENAVLWPLVAEGRLRIENLPGVGDVVGAEGSPWRPPTLEELARRDRAKAVRCKAPGPGPDGRSVRQP